MSGDNQQTADAKEAQQQPDSPFSEASISQSFRLRQMLDQQPQHHMRHSDSNHPEYGNHLQPAKPSVSFQKSSVGHVDNGAPHGFGAGRSERDSAMSVEFAGQSYAQTATGPIKGHLNDSDELLHHPPSMRWQQ